MSITAKIFAALFLLSAVAMSGTADAKRRRKKGKGRSPRVEQRVVPEAESPATPTDPRQADAPPAAAVERRIAITPVRLGEGLDPGIADQIAARIAAALGREPDTSVITPADIRTMLEHEGNRQLLGCDDEACMAEIANALGAELIISSQLDEVAEGLSLSLAAIAPQHARVETRINETWRGERLRVLDLAEVMADRLVHPHGRGSLEIVGAIDGSQVLVDEALRAQLPTAKVDDLPTGAHAIRLLADGKEPYETWVIVRRDETTSVAVDQKDPPGPFYQTWWFWTATGAVVAGAGAGTYLLLRGNDGAGPTGANIAVNAATAFESGR